MKDHPAGLLWFQDWPFYVSRFTSKASAFCCQQKRCSRNTSASIFLDQGPPWLAGTGLTFRGVRQEWFQVVCSYLDWFVTGFCLLRSLSVLDFRFHFASPILDTFAIWDLKSVSTSACIPLIGSSFSCLAQGCICSQEIWATTQGSQNLPEPMKAPNSLCKVGL